MARLPGRVCGHLGCAERAVKGSRYCDAHRKKRRASYDQRRGTSTQRLYDSRWRRVRVTFLDEHPLCVECQRNGEIKSATVVDHIIPHDGDVGLFWDENNWQALCETCHNRKTVTEDGGFGNQTIGGGGSKSL